MEDILKKEAISNDLILQGPPSIYEPGKGGVGYEIFRSLSLNKGKIAQVDLIDMQSESNGDYKFILNYQDHLTKFVVLRPLKTKTADEVSDVLLEILCLLRAPYILHSDNGREFCNQISVSTDTTDSYENLLQRCIRTAIYLSKNKLMKDDIVCLCSENSVDSIVPFIASTFVGTTYASIEPSMHEDDVVYDLNYIKPKLLFVSEEFESKIETCLQKSEANCELVILGKSIKYTNFSNLLVASEEENNFYPVFINDLKETVVIFLSSGTTGNSKGICLNHYSFLAQVFNLFHYNYRQGTINLSNFSYKYDDKEESKFLFYSPMYWATGTMFSLGLFFSGGTKLIGSIFTGKDAWEAMEKYEPNTIFFPPGQANELCSYAMDKKPNFSLRVFIIYTGAVSEKLMNNIRKSCPRTKVVQGYGQTENSGLLTTFNIDDSEDSRLQEAHLDSCGRIAPTFQMKVVDLDSEKPLGLGMEGELRVKCKYLMNGYYKMDSSSAFDSNGWFKTGDLVYFDEDHCLHIVDRVKDILDYALHWINPSVIEKILSQHDAVLENFVFGYPHPKDTEHAMAVVLLKEEFRNKVSEEEIITFVNDRVPNDWYKIRAGIKFVNRMLRTPTGKLKKIEMKRLIIAGTI